MNDLAARTLGRKIAFHRLQRGLSQRDFGAMIDRSETWVSQVERGVRRIDRMTVLRRVADALDVPLNELAADTPIVAAAVNESDGLTDLLRMLLSSSLALRSVVRPGPEPDLAALTGEVNRAWTLTHEVDLSEAVGLLVELLPHLESACRSVAGKKRGPAFALLAETYQATAAVLAKLSDTGPAWVAADRAIGAAERSGDPLLMAAGAFRLALVFQADRRYDQVAQIAQTAAEAIEPLVKSGDPAAVSIAGALRLQLAVVAARTNDAERAQRELATARDLGERLGQDRNDYHTEFGPLNVRLHEVAVAVDLGDAGTALRLAAGIDPSGASPERQARVLIDIARAHLQRRNVSGVIRALLDAEALTPQHVQTHRLVKNIVYDLARSEHRTDPRVRGLANRCGVHVGSR